MEPQVSIGVISFGMRGSQLVSLLTAGWHIVLPILIMMKANVTVIALIVVAAYLGSRCTSNKNREHMQVVTSEDGTKIAYEKTGKGPTVILVGGALASRLDHVKLAERLSENYTVYNFDRRGRGDSGDTKPYAVRREIEDIEALIDQAGGSAFVYGISSGACLALEAGSTLGGKIKKIAVYEAPYDEADDASKEWREYSAELNEHVAAGRHEEAVEFHMKFVGVPDTALLAMKALPKWSAMKTLAPTLPYDVAVVGEDRAIPVDRIAAIEANCLVMDGAASAESMPFMRASADKIAQAIPGAQRRTLDGQDHNVSEKALEPILTSFFSKD